MAKKASRQVPASTADGYFTSASLRFLSELAENNSREWFTANRPRYEAEVKQPFLRLIADLQAPLQALSPHYLADPRPVGGSLFRIHRDTRFAADKRPYKTWAGARFYHVRMQELDGESPVFYLHVQPGGSFVGGGVWHPGAPSLARIRNYLVNNPKSWQKIVTDPSFKQTFTLGGDSLTRMPRGYEPNHPLAEDLRRKDFVCMAPLSDAELCAPTLMQTLVARLTQAGPLVDWLSGALDLDY